MKKRRYIAFSKVKKFLEVKNEVGFIGYYANYLFGCFSVSKHNVLNETETSLQTSIGPIGLIEKRDIFPTPEEALENLKRKTLEQYPKAPKWIDRTLELIREDRIKIY